MRVLDVGALPLAAEHRRDPLVLRFIELDDRTSRAEMISDPDAWFEDEWAAYQAGDWQAFSRLRGYTAAEIADFADFLQTAGEIDAKYGLDTATSLSYLAEQHRSTS
ncbi:hypothetical protein [Massilia orientalis]|uniref:Uncharacterized protein n=1 Tax=Massilia orientalis TaxID=3050128 RepID=A0ACC7MDZ5_9BURK|nr:hypothetical protein [Massilia sp. YIM B02787]